MSYQNKLLKAAEKSPAHFYKLLNSSYRKGKEFSDDFLRLLFLEMIQKNPSDKVILFLPKIVDLISEKKGLQPAYNILSGIEVLLNFRKSTIGIYDHAFHLIGGAQKYGCTIAHALQNDFDITLIANKNIGIDELQKWYNLDLSRCQIKIIKIPFFENRELNKSLIEPGIVDLKKDNPFHIISRESGNYDIFINNCMLEMVYPLANLSLFICHFPEREKSRFFYVNKYSEIICNSQYTASWIKRRWDMIPQKIAYPPVDMEAKVLPEKKENVLLSVSRFDLGGNKQQIEIIKAYENIVKKYPERMKGWKLMLVGGSFADNPYLEKIRKILSEKVELHIVLKVNISAEELKLIFQKSKIFWHFAGLNQSDPARFEHFGMTVAESMQSGCVPIVFNGGGQREIIENNISGFLFSSEKELFEKTLELIENPDLLNQISQNAFERGKQFRKEIFITEIKTYFNQFLMKNLGSC